MWADIIDLRDFYTRPLGLLARRLIARRLREIWPDLGGKRLLGVGFAVPFLGLFHGDAERVLAVMPAGQGVMHWPEGERSRVTLADEDALPFPDRSIDRMLVVHCLEGSDHLRAFLRECWRVLADGGRLVVVVANRRGFWARAERSPFAHGRPYSMRQITGLLRENLFVPLTTATTLFVPPVWWRLFGSWAMALDNIGARCFPTFAGVLVVEAEKQIYAAPFVTSPAAARGRVLARPFSSGLRRSGPCQHE